MTLNIGCLNLTKEILKSNSKYNFNTSIFEIHNECFPENNHVQQTHIDTIINMCTNQFSKLLINKDNKELIGYILILVGGRYTEDGYSSIADEKYCILFNIGIKKEYQNKKIGFTYLKKVMDEIRFYNFNTQLIVREDNLRAQRVYKKLNFIQERVIENHFQNININGLVYTNNNNRM